MPPVAVTVNVAFAPPHTVTDVGWLFIVIPEFTVSTAQLDVTPGEQVPEIITR